jgi:hypothetical protein
MIHPASHGSIRPATIFQKRWPGPTRSFSSLQMDYSRFIERHGQALFQMKGNPGTLYPVRPGGLEHTVFRYACEHMITVDWDATLERIMRIQRARDTDPPIEIRLSFSERDAIVLSLPGKDALDIYNFFQRLLRVRNRAQRQPGAPTDRERCYCPTCETYKFCNSAHLCRLCGDSLNPVA